MRTCTRIANLTVGLVLLAAPLAAQAFEGVVAYKMPSEKKVGEMTMSIKGTHIRTDMATEGHTMAMLIDAQAQSMTMLMPEQKMYMTMDLKAARAKAQGDRTPPKITALGTSETIAGHACQNYLVETAKSKTELCSATGLGNFMMPQNPMARGPTADMPDLEGEAYRAYFKDGFFPLRMVKLAGEKRTVIMEATRVEPKPLDPSLFTVPAGLTEMKMPM
jgi:hypothetical protein